MKQLQKLYSKNSNLMWSKLCKDLDILEYIRTSYDNFLQENIKIKKNIGLNHVFKTFFDYINQYVIKDIWNGYYFQYNGYKVINNNSLSEEECLKKKQSFTCTINLKITLLSKNNKQPQYSFNFIMFELPKLAKGNNFLINGNYRSIVSRLVNNNGVILAHNATNNTTKLNIRPDYGINITINYDKYNNKVNIVIYGHKMSVDVFLLLTGFFNNFTRVINHYFNSKIIDIKLLDIKHNSFIILDNDLSEFLSMPNKTILEINNEHIISRVKQYYQDIKKNKIKVYFIEHQHILFNSINREHVDITEWAIKIFKINKQTVNTNHINKKEILLKFRERFFNVFFYFLSEASVYHTNQLLGINEQSNVLTFNIFDKSLKYYLDYIYHYKEQPIDINSLNNKRILNVGEYLYDIVAQIFNRLRYYNVKKLNEITNILQNTKLTQKDSKKKIKTVLISLLNTNFFQSYIDKFFNRDFRSQFEDQLNLLSEINHRRKILLIKKEGDSHNKKSTQIRAIHSSYSGKICSILTSEGQKIGLSVVPTMFVKINKHGILRVPYYRVTNSKIDTSKIVFLTLKEEYTSFITHYDKTIKNNIITQDIVICKHRSGFVYKNKDMVQYVYIHNLSTLSPEAAMIPFVENTATTRLMTGCNMYKQSSLLLKPEIPNVMSGMEEYLSKYDYSNIYSKHNGTVQYIDSTKIVIKTKDKQLIEQNFGEIEKNNKNSMYSSWPVVSKNETVAVGQTIASNLNIINGNIFSMGVNLRIAYMPRNLFTYEDGIVISDRLIKERILTDIKIREYILECKENEEYTEKFTNILPNTSINILSKLDHNGLIREGSIVRKNDVLIGKLSPNLNNKNNNDIISKLIGKKNSQNKNTSLYYRENFNGIVIASNILNTIENGINKKIAIVKILSLHDVEKGDKTSARFGNKGIFTFIENEVDMPFINNTGETIDIIISPTSIPSRMNIGQLFESALGRVSDIMTKKNKIKTCFVSEPFSGFDMQELEEILQKNYKTKINQHSKFWLRDGKTGKMYKKPITVGTSYFFKLNHNVDDKINSRSTGYYSLITTQPPSGKTNNGAQRLGEMENWSFEAFGAALYQYHALNWRSDNLFLRTKFYNDIVKKSFVEIDDYKLNLKQTLSESAKYFLNIIYAMGFGIKLLDKNNEELLIDQTINLEEEEI